MPEKIFEKYDMWSLRRDIINEYESMLYEDGGVYYGNYGEMLDIYEDEHVLILAELLGYDLLCLS